MYVSRAINEYLEEISSVRHNMKAALKLIHWSMQLTYCWHCLSICCLGLCLRMKRQHLFAFLIACLRGYRTRDTCTCRSIMSSIVVATKPSIGRPPRSGVCLNPFCHTEHLQTLSASFRAGRRAAGKVLGTALAWIGSCGRRNSCGHRRWVGF
jgi:hypothetical protein